MFYIYDFIQYYVVMTLCENKRLDNYTLGG